jgi:L-lysine exporter family protein LysE/ArgO
MIEAITLGFFTGVFLSLGFGSVFFALIQDSIDYGYRAGIKISLGVVFGDFLMVAIAFLGTSFLPQIPNFSLYSRAFGSILLISLGFAQFRKRKLNPKIKKVKMARFFYFFVKGFLLNIINPMNFIAWMVTSATLKGYKYEYNEEIVFFVDCISTIFLVESAIAYFSHQVKNKIKEATISKISYLTGMVFIGVGLKFIIDILKYVP